MRKAFATLAVLLVLCAPAGAAERMRFWNLLTSTITQLSLAPAGTNQWGKNQCENDKDKSVDSDERLTLTDIEPGRYDVKFADNRGRQCVLRNVEVKGGQPYAFSIEEDELKNCEK